MERVQSSARPILLSLLMLFSTVAVPFYTVASSTAENSGSAVPLDIFRLASGDLGTPSMAGGSDGSFHIVWSENSSKLMYSLINSDGVIEQPPIRFAVTPEPFNEVKAVVFNDLLYVVYLASNSTHDCIRYHFSDPSTDSSSNFYDPSTVNSGSLLCKPVTASISNLAMAVDSMGAAHIVWDDQSDPLGLRWGLPGVHYQMMTPIWSGSVSNSPIFDTLLTSGATKATHPELVVTDDDEIMVTWQDSRWSLVEIVAVLDTMDTWEVRDFCDAMYGTSSIEGAKNVADDNDIDLLETVYGVGDYDPNCPGHATNQQSRSVYLTPTDDSGGSRKLHRGMYNGGVLNWNHREHWGPGTTWACLSWMDGNGNVGNSANPPTIYDHRWNPDATKLLVTASSEGPYFGDPPASSEDYQTIGEAHEACVDGAIPPYSMIWDGTTSTNNAALTHSHMWDLSTCKAATPSVGARACPGTSVFNTNSGGHNIDVRGSNTDVLAEKALIHIANSGGSEIAFKIIDPHARLRSTSHVNGTPAIDTTQGFYEQDTGWGGALGTHFVVLNDSRATWDEAFSIRPKVVTDSDGLFHFVWSDGRQTSSSAPSDHHETFYRKFDLGLFDYNGQEQGIDLSQSGFGFDNLSFRETVSGVGARDADAHSSQPNLIIDNDGLMHAVWVEHDSNDGVSVAYRRSIDATTQTGQARTSAWWGDSSDGSQALQIPTPTYQLSDWDSNKMGAGGLNVLVDVDRTDGDEPALAVTSDSRQTAAAAWVDSEPCGLSSSLSGVDHLCIKRIQRSLIHIEPSDSNFEYFFEPGEVKQVSFEIENFDSANSADMDVNIFVEGAIGSDWSIVATIGSNGIEQSLDPVDETWQISGSSSMPMNLEVTAPSKQDATDMEYFLLRVGVESDDGSHSSQVTLEIRLNVIHDLVLSTPQDTIEVEQGGSGLFSVNVSNYGNIWETVNFPSSTSEVGRQIWQLQSGWQISFPSEVDMLADSSTISKTLQVEVPDSASPGNYTLLVVGTSDKSSSPGTTEGALVSLELHVDVIRKRAGNLVFELWDDEEEVDPGECAEFSVALNKYYGDDDVIVLIDDGPVERPTSVEEDVWRQDHWIMEVDYSGLPGGNGVSPDSPRPFTNGMRKVLIVSLCAPTEALAGETESVTIRAELDQDSQTNDIVSMSATVVPVEELDVEWIFAPDKIDPGQSFEATIGISNEGNVPQTFELRLGDEMDGWLITTPEDTASGLSVGDSMEVIATIDVPMDAPAGLTSVFVEAHVTTSPDSLRAEVAGEIEVLPRIDFELLMADGQSNIVTLTPTSIWDIGFLVVNAGNLAQAPWIDNHTTGVAEGIALEPRIDGLEGVVVTWFVVENAGTPLAVFSNLKADDEGHLTLPLMQPGDSVQVVLRVTTFGFPGWYDDSLGVRVVSPSGFSNQEGDIDADRKWLTIDDNEQIIDFTFSVPDIMVSSVSESLEDGNLMLTVTLKNQGNLPAENFLVRACGMTMAKFEDSGCSRSDSLSEQRVSYVSEVVEGTPSTHIVILKITSSTESVVIFADAENELAEGDESNNQMDLKLALRPGDEGSSDSVLGVAQGDLLMYLMGVLWLLIILVGLSAWRGRRRDRRQARVGWQDDGGWGTEVTRKTKKVMSQEIPESQHAPMATVHSMGADPARTNAAPSYDDLDLGLSDLSEPSVSQPIEVPRKEKKNPDEFTIGDLIDDLL